MRWPLLSLAGVFLGSLCAAAYEIPVKPKLDIRKLAGKWHPILRAKYDPTEQLFLAFTLIPLSDGNVILKVEVPRMETCRLKFVALYGVRPGIFENAEGHVLVHIVDTDYDKYIVTHTEKKDTSFMDLLGKDPDVSEEATKNFLDLARKVMPNPMLLFYQQQTDVCRVPP